MNYVACCITTTEQHNFNERCWDGHVVNSDSLDPVSNADDIVFLFIVGHAGDVDSSWRNTAEHGTGALPQHQFEGEYLGLILYLGS